MLTGEEQLVGVIQLRRERLDHLDRSREIAADHVKLLAMGRGDSRGDVEIITAASDNVARAQQEQLT